MLGLYSGTRRRHDTRERELLADRAAHEELQQETDAIADLGRRTMAELHRTVRLLRDDDERRPAGSLSALDDLVDRAHDDHARLRRRGP